MKKTCGAFALVAAMTAMTGLASADEENCKRQEEYAGAMLYGGYVEFMSGIDTDGNLLQLYVSTSATDPDQATWEIALTNPGPANLSYTCPVVTGESGWTYPESPGKPFAKEGDKKAFEKIRANLAVRKEIQEICSRSFDFNAAGKKLKNPAYHLAWMGTGADGNNATYELYTFEEGNNFVVLRHVPTVNADGLLHHPLRPSGTEDTFECVAAGEVVRVIDEKSDPGLKSELKNGPQIGL